MFDWFEPAFMRRALLSLVFASGAASLLGTYVVAFRMSFFAEAISHSAFTGVALGVLFGVSPGLAVIAFGLVVAVGVMRLSRRAELSTDVAIGVFFAAVVALGIVIVSARGGLSRSFSGVIFGDVLSVTGSEVVLLGALFAGVWVFQAAAFNPLLIVSLHPPIARARGIRATLWETLFGMLVALAVLVSIRAVGVLLVTALLIVPAAAARNFARSAGGAMWWSLAVAVVSSVAGLWLSYAFDSAPGATAVLASVALFAASLLVKAFRGA